ncbi:hypothetical protein BCR33DRAFT_169913 [Rhizoclosmatium globosum]|uniref:Uncharacterized protein n=1 Tax=Rhizoclosmatium globosum TaxID=329046 RepID=A0A1Y2CEP5_9FUNG|nr:hypothetical protein BCR33DRAFT_169913 [Rhizoclosmatium globosum]|eukprot:ORY45538.1 hypothetical protein BCR33DRAFT_169913 [Rhizoclosmatium globosum]
MVVVLLGGWLLLGFHGWLFESHFPFGVSESPWVELFITTWHGGGCGTAVNAGRISNVALSC